MKWVTELAQFPDISINDLGFLASVISRIWREHFGMVKEMIPGS